MPIEFKTQGKKFSLTIQQIADVEIEAIPGAGGADVQVSGHPLCIAPGFAATAGRSKHLTYTDYAYDWSLSERNGLSSPFRYQG